MICHPVLDIYICTEIQCVVLGDKIEAQAGAGSELKFLLIAGKPIGEPIVQHGPFVMNTQVLSRHSTV